MGQIVRVTTAGGSLIGRLVAMDLRYGLTLGVPIAGVQEDAVPNPIELRGVPIADVLVLEAADGAVGPLFSHQISGTRNESERSVV